MTTVHSRFKNTESLIIERKAWYNNLPRVKKEPEWHEKILKILKEIALGICFPLHLYKMLVVLYPASILDDVTLDTRKFSHLAQQRLKETSEKIRQIARKAGIEHPENLSIKIFNKSGASPAATGIACTQPTILASPEWLVQPEDLPAELQLQNVEQNKISEQEWTERFEVWLWKDFLQVQRPKNTTPHTQLSADKERLTLQVWRRVARDRQAFANTFEMIVGHECGHLQHAHLLLSGLFRFAWSILCLASCGLLVLLTKKVTNIISRIHEKEADMFSVSKTGQAEAGARFFEHAREKVQALRQKYPELHAKITPEGDRIDGTHPSCSERIRYLRNGTAG